MQNEFCYETPSYLHGSEVSHECKTSIPDFLNEYEVVDDYVASVCSTETGQFLPIEDVKTKLKKFVVTSTGQAEDKRDDDRLKKFLFDPDSCSQFAVKMNRPVQKKQPKFFQKFTFVVSNCSSENLLLLMELEILMKKEMTELIRSRNMEVDEISKKCEKVLEEMTDVHPHKLTVLNEKLRQVYAAYTNQVADLSEIQRKRYRKAVDNLYNRGSFPADVIEETGIDKIDSASTILERRPESRLTDGINESFTIYIGAQLKSMHNACITTVDTLTNLCQTFEDDWTTCNRLDTATKLYARNLTGVVLLVPKDPLYHVNSSSAFFRVCEQSTELHFDCLAEQLKKIRESTRIASIRRSTRETSQETESTTRYTSNEVTLSVGDVYCTRHSNLHRAQLVYHLVVDEHLQSADISSRHPCLNGIRNAIKMTAKFGISSIYLPLLLIDRPDESTTINWCVKRAELVYKCVKGYLMEVCGGTQLDNVPHYNVHFVLPSGLSPIIYNSISTMFPTVFHLVPSVSVTID